MTKGAALSRSRYLPEDFGFGRLFWKARDGIIVANAKSESIVLWNPAATAILGYSVEEALELPLHHLVPERLRERHRAALAHYQKTGRGSLIDRDTPVELPALHKTGREIQIELSLTSIEDREGAEGRHVWAMFRDITERKKAEEAYRRAKEEALRELSVPVLRARAGLLLLPLVGSVDTQRAADMTERLLKCIREHRARVVVIDVTGVPAVDTGVANHLLQTANAARLLGAAVIVTGLSAEVATTIATLGLDLKALHIAGGLEDGIEVAERLLAH